MRPIVALVGDVSPVSRLDEIGVVVPELAAMYPDWTEGAA